ncbi:lantibiotic dehydratase [Clostridium chrysemydis]|uniref:lantibiotic dehydratase n=1 Tax=Clostridium chrysemydis TaxID=2665504 RepID=UPI0018834491|nr:lantibiotic dehydratase [Clostridium chrysemydis]
MYSLSDVFLLRTPLKSYSTFLNNSNTSKSEENYYDNLLEEGILISSYNLHETISNYKRKNVKFDSALKNSIKKYYVRQCTRATPFGLFAGVSLGNFKDTKCEFNSNTYNQTKHISPDYKWIMKVVKTIELHGNLKNVTLFSNEALFSIGNRIINYYSPKYSQKNDSDSNTLEITSIKNSPYISAILEKSKNGIKYNDLVDTLKELNNKLDSNRIENFILNLLSEEYLYTDLRPTFDTNNPLKDLIDKLHHYSVNFYDLPILEDIDKLFYEYNNSAFGFGTSILEKIYSKMKYFSDDDKFINVNYKNQFKVTIPNFIKDEIKDVIDALSILSLTNNYNNQMRDHVNKFLEKYGIYREIPVLELLNEDFGIGSPSDYTNPPSSNPIFFNSINNEDLKKRDFLMLKITEALAKNTDVFINDSDLINFKETSYKSEEYLDSLEINFLLSSLTSNDLENGNYTLTIAPNLGSPGAGKSFGRFNDVLNLSNIEKEVLKREAELYEDTLNAEIIAAPIKGRNGNITFSNIFRDYFVNILVPVSNEKTRIHIDDILVGVENNLFYLKSKSLNKRIIISSNHMLNYQQGCNVYRFLREVCNYRQVREPFSFITYDLLNKFTFVPRIKYKNTVLRTATWNLFKTSFTDPYNLENFSKEFSKKRIELNIPNLVYITESDNRTLINLEDSSSIKDILNQINKKNKCVLTEFEFDSFSNWLSINDQSYITEITTIAYKNYTSFEKNNINKNLKLFPTQSDLTTKRSLVSSFDTNRNTNILDNWIYLKLYCNSKKQGEIIGIYIKQLIDNLKSTNSLEKHFFIRYDENGSHIRLRLKSQSKESSKVILNELSVWTKFLLENKILNNISLDSYVREIERYGGPLTIDAAETFFSDQSSAIESFFNLKEQKQSSFNTDIFVVLNLINIMESCEIEFEDQLSIFDTISNKNELRDFFQKNRKYLLKVCNSDDDWNGLRSEKGGLDIYNLLTLQNKSTKDYFDKINEIDNTDNLYNTKLNIIFSSFHMLCNRVLGTDRNKEKEIFATVRHCLYALKFFKKGAKKNV